MMFPDIENSDDGASTKNIQLRGQRKITNNNSVMTNFNPLTAMDTYENNTNDGIQYLSSNQIGNSNSH